MAPVEGQVDPSGDWQTWHTEHFRVHAKAEYESFAFKGAREAERAYRLLATELRPPRGTIDMVLGDNVDFSNGYATVMPSNRMVIYLTPPSTAISTGNYDIWLRLVIVHELVHLFHLDRADGMWNVLQKVFGRAPGLFPNTYQPMWVTEGLATYYESKFSAAGRERGYYFEQLLVGAARDDEWPNPGEATFANRVWPAGSRPYAWGSRFFGAEIREFGDSLIPRYIDKTSRQLIVFNVNSPMKGAGTDGVDSGWERLRMNSQSDGTTGELVVRGLRSEPRPRVSVDGRLLAYRNNDGKNIERLIVHDLERGEEVASHRTNLVEGLVWVDSSLFLTQLEFDTPVDIRSDLYRWTPGGEWTRLTRGSRDTDVFVSRFGRLGVIGLDTAVRGARTVDHVSMESATFPLPRADDWGRIAVSPGGEWVAAARHANGHWDIVVWPWDRPGQFEHVTSDRAMDADPVWSTDGTALMFASERRGMPQIYSYSMASKQTTRLTNEPTGAREPAISPSGTLYYSTALSDGYAIVRQQGPLLGADATVSLDQPLQVDSAPNIEVRGAGYTPWGALRPHFWIPIGHDEESSGFFIGALTAGVDAIERTAYNAAATVAPSTGRWEGWASL
ncbi:MAG: PD40 domain-containing protein, partial [Gemmatimonadota bacterium]